MSVGIAVADGHEKMAAAAAAGGAPTMNGGGMMDGSLPGGGFLPLSAGVKYVCRICKKSDRWRFVVIPYALRYLIVELMGMGVNVMLEC
jgi:hypothetical protein